MNILFLFQRFSFASSTIYLDLVEACNEAGHKVYVLAGTSEEVDTSCLINEHGCSVAYVKLPDQFKTNKIKKGIVQLLIEPLMLKTLKRLMWNEKIDLIAYPTPPITLAGVVKKAKKHYGAKSYLMLKDIFPQNAADLGMMSASSPVFKYFKWVEGRLYEVSDTIGCMSKANIEYMKKHTKEHLHNRLELFPNTVKINELTNDEDASCDANGPVKFVIGGNLGKPQGLEFVLDGIEKLIIDGYREAKFLIIGDGTEAAEVARRFGKLNSEYAQYKKSLPRAEYEKLLNEQDVGIISLSSDFTVPNFPSRLLSYMQMAKPILVVTDSVSDMGAIVENEAKCGYFVGSDDIDGFISCIKKICSERDGLKELGMNGRRYLIENYDVQRSVEILAK